MMASWSGWMVLRMSRSGRTGCAETGDERALVVERGVASSLSGVNILSQ